MNRAPVPRQPPAPAAESDGTSPAAALAAIGALDGNHRRMLLDRLAATDPDVVARGIQWLADWEAGARERRRVSHNRDSKDRRDRRRAGTTGR